MDYSLLVGLHFRDDSTRDKMGLSPFLLRTGIDQYHNKCLEITLWYSKIAYIVTLNPSFAGKSDSYQNEKFMRGCRFLEAELQDMDRVLAGR